jgi:hypothetical protein
MGVLNIMITKKGSNIKGKSTATCKNEKKIDDGHIVKRSIGVVQ